MEDVLVDGSLETSALHGRFGGNARIVVALLAEAMRPAVFSERSVLGAGARLGAGLSGLSGDESDVPGRVYGWTERLNTLSGLLDPADEFAPARQAVDDEFGDLLEASVPPGPRRSRAGVLMHAPFLWVAIFGMARNPFGDVVAVMRHGAVPEVTASGVEIWRRRVPVLAAAFAPAGGSAPSLKLSRTPDALHHRLPLAAGST